MAHNTQNAVSRSLYGQIDSSSTLPSYQCSGSSRQEGRGSSKIGMSGTPSARF